MLCYSLAYTFRQLTGTMCIYATVEVTGLLLKAQHSTYVLLFGLLSHIDTASFVPN